MLPLCAISSSNKRRYDAADSRRNFSWMSRAQKVSTQDSMAAPGGSAASRNSGSPPCNIRRLRSVTPKSFMSRSVIGVSQTLPMRPAGAGTGGHAWEAGAPVSPVPKGRVDVVRILTVGNRLAASTSSSRAFPRRPTSSRTTVRPCKAPRNASGRASSSRVSGAEQSRKSPGAAAAHGRAAARANTVFPAPRTPTTETTDCRSHASAIRFCQKLARRHARMVAYG